jgi:hypothetical protein
MKILATSYCPTSLEGNGGGPDGGPAPVSPGSLVPCRGTSSPHPSCLPHPGQNPRLNQHFFSSLGLSGMTGPEHPFYRCLPAPGSGSIGPRH